MILDLSKQLEEHFKKHRGDLRSDRITYTDVMTKWLESGASQDERFERMVAWTQHHGIEFTDSQFQSAHQISRFMARLGAAGKADSILDPACGIGLLLGFAVKEAKVTSVTGIEINASTAATAKAILPSEAQIHCGDSLRDQFETPENFDLILCEPPLNVRVKDQSEIPEDLEKVTDLGTGMLRRYARRLSDNGTALFVFPPWIVGKQGSVLREQLEKDSLYIRAMILIPSGHLRAAKVDTYLVIVDRIKRESIFTAQFGSDETLQSSILENYRKHQPGRLPAQGRLAQFEEFHGFHSLAAAEKLETEARKAGASSVPMADLVASHELLDFSKPLEIEENDSTNDVYLSLRGRANAVLHPADLRLKSRSRHNRVVRLVLAPNVADARFVCEYLNQEGGKLFLKTVSAGAMLHPNISLEALLRATIWLPPVATQERVAEAKSMILGLRAELAEIESSLDAQPTKVEEHLKKISKVNHEDTLEAWLETIPFPLASILWRYLTVADSAKEKNEVLLHFFEALAQFWATIHLSAARTDSDFWTEYREQLQTTVSRAKFRFDLATFGLWKCVVEFFSKKFRKLSEDDRSRCSEMFATSRDDVLGMLFDRRLLTILQQANSLRNQFAHGGATSLREHESVHDQLFDLVRTCREFMKENWSRYELILPGKCEFVDGLLHYETKRIMGTRTPFQSAERITVAGLEKQTLHLLDPGESKGMALIPLIRIMASPQTEANACYFYNKSVGNSQTFVSYHFEAESEVNDTSGIAMNVLQNLELLTRS